MTSLEDLKIEIDSISDILIRANLFYNDSRYFSNPTSESERETKKAFKYLNQIHYSTWILTVLEFCKLFDNRESQQFNILKFLKKLNSSLQKLNIQNKVDSKDIKKWEYKLNSDNVQETIEKLKNLRDQYYAHRDRNPKYTVSDLIPDNESLDNLLNIGKEIVFEIYNKVFEIHQLFDIPGKINASKVLRHLAELKEYQDKELKFSK
jgi:hypothetical protein